MTENEVADIKANFLPGTRIILNHMEDPRPIKPGTFGTVRLVDDIGTIHVDFDNGRSLGVIPNVDSFEKI